jgi:hypothetical protein
MNDQAPRRDVILTMLYRMRFDAVAPFYFSLKQTGFTGDIVAFVTMIDDETVADMNRHGIITIPFRFHPRIVRRTWWFDPLRRWFFKSSLSQAKKEKLAHAVFPLFYRRQLLYLEFLRTNRQKYGRVFITDCRDVFFQANPFSWDPPAGVHFFLEESANKIGQCSHHIRWIKSQFGRQVLAELADETISCAGTTLGDVESIIQYLSTMVSLSMAARSLREHDGDQGIHNYILRKNMLPRTTLHENRHGPVMTMGAMKTSDAQLNVHGYVVNDNGTLPVVLHQYDRLKQVQNTLLNHLEMKSSV